MKYEVCIKGRLPGMNEYTQAQRTNRYRGGQMKHEAQALCEGYIYKFLHGVHISKPVALHYTFYEQNTRRDHDNVSGFAHKVIQDALVACKVLKDDGWKEIVSYSDKFFVDKFSPRIEVTIEEVEV